MSTASIGSVIRDLFKAPLEAATGAEADYLKIWAKWLAFKKDLMFAADGSPLGDIQALLATAPVIDLSGKIELAITMRIAEVKKTDLGIGGGISVGPFFASGNYGSSAQSSQESIFQAAATFLLSNQKKDLPEFLQAHQLNIASPADVDTVVQKLNDEADKLNSG